MKRLSLFFSHRFAKGHSNDGPQPIQSAGAAAGSAVWSGSCPRLRPDGTAVRHAGLRAGAGAPVRRPELQPGTSTCRNAYASYPRSKCSASTPARPRCTSTAKRSCCHCWAYSPDTASENGCTDTSSPKCHPTKSCSTPPSAGSHWRPRPSSWPWY